MTVTTTAESGVDPRVAPKTELTVITPQQAASWIEHANVNNRNVSWEFVGFLADQIRSGYWVVDGNPIRLDYNGKILDGQHRLLAIMESATAVESFVTTGLAPKAQQVMDTGRRRSLGDQLKLKGEKNTQQLAATITRIWLTRIGENALRNPTRYRPSVPAALKLLAEEPGIRLAVREGGRTSQKLGGTSVAVLAASYYLFSEKDQEHADQFFEQLRDGTNLSAGDPVLMLRNRLTQNSRERGNTPAFIIQAWVIKAWNAFREEMPVSQISYRAIGTNPEAFPTII